MLRWPPLRLVLTLLLAAGLALGGVSFADPAAAAPVDCPHHAGLASSAAADHADAGHEHGGKKGGCHCPLMTCSGWTLAPIAFDLLPLDPGAVPHQPMATAAFAPHPPGVPLQPPRA